LNAIGNPVSVHFNLTGAVFEITGILSNFSRNGTTLNLTEIMFEITGYHLLDTKKLRNNQVYI
jgi:hypothetical protein